MPTAAITATMTPPIMMSVRMMTTRKTRTKMTTKICRTCRSSKNCLNGLYCEKKGRYVEYAVTDGCGDFNEDI